MSKRPEYERSKWWENVKKELEKKKYEDYIR